MSSNRSSTRRRGGRGRRAHGLMLAGDLAEAGVRVTVLERRAPSRTSPGPSPCTPARWRSCRSAVSPTSSPATGPRSRRCDCTGVRRSTAGCPARPLAADHTQFQTERVLTERLDGLGVSITDECRVWSSAPRMPQEWRCESRGTDDGAERRYRARPTRSARTGCTARYAPRWGCRSRVGRWSGRSCWPTYGCRDPSEDVLAVNGVGDAFAFVAPFGDGWYRIFAWNRLNQVDDSAPLESVRGPRGHPTGAGHRLRNARPRFLSPVPQRRATGADLPGRAGVPGGRRGALPFARRGPGHEHRHPGRGEPRLETGRRRGRMGRRAVAGLLPRRAAPRRAPGTAQQRPARAARPDPPPVGPGRSRHRRHALLSVPPISERVAETISAIGVRYPAPHGMDRRVGTRAPDVELADGRRLHDALRGGRFVLLGPSTATIDSPPQVDVVEQPDGESTGGA